MGNSQCRWTKEEIAILKECEGKKTTEEVFHILEGRRSEPAIRYKCKKIGITLRNYGIWKRKRWSSDELEYLKKNYRDKSLTELHDGLKGRHSKSSINSMAYTLKISKGRNVNPWTEEEDAIIRDFYPDEGIKTADRLPGRTSAAVKARARLLGIQSLKTGEHVYPGRTVWTQDDIDVVKECYGTCSMEELSSLIGNRHSPQSVYVKLRKEGVIKEKHRWTEEEIAFLKKSYKDFTMPEIVARFKNRHPAEAIYLMAARLGIRK